MLLCPQADGKRLVLVSRVGVCVWAVIMGAIMCIAQVAGINVNWLITIIGAARCQHPTFWQRGRLILRSSVVHVYGIARLLG